MPHVAKAVIPAAGLGSRMLPISKGIPKEMFPAGRKPMIQHTVEEAIASGIKQICIVIRKGKELIKDYFCLRYPYNHKRDKSLDELEALVSRCEITFVYQERQLGLGDAIMQARDFVGSGSFVMMIPDQLMHSNIPATLQLLKHRKPGSSIWSSMLKIPKEEARFFVGARGYEYKKSVHHNEFVVTNLYTEEETRLLYGKLDYEVRGFGRTVYPSEIFNYLGDECVNPQTGEVDLLKTFEKSREKIPHYGVFLEGEPFDLGTLQGYYRYLPRLWDLNI